MSALEVAFDASGAAEAGSRGRVVAVVDVIDASTSAEAALIAGAAGVFGAAPDAERVPVPVHPERVADLAAASAERAGGSIVVVSEPRVGTDDDRRFTAGPVIGRLDELGARYTVIPNQGGELASLASFAGAVVIVVSATGGSAFDAALAAGAPAVCFATSGRVPGLTGWQVLDAGAGRAADLARRHGAGLTLVAASANSTDDVEGAMQLARTLLRLGFAR